MNPNNYGVRLNKAMSMLGMCSRREADRLITSGHILVNGIVVTELGTKIASGDTISLSTGGSNVFSHEVTRRMWMYYKPVGLITSHRDPNGRATVFDDVTKKVRERMISIGRLDINSEGLLLLTNSGEVARYAELPSTALERRYRVRIFGNLSDDIISQLTMGVTVHGARYAPMKLRRLQEPLGKNSWVECILTEGKNREIRRLFDYFGIAVNRLIRTHYGPYAIGNLRPGEIREVECLTL
ncbi:MAG: rRNA pseudouridine synthase [Holosporales bacterium]|jgi:23S rRNA pseudouridine2605 synthase|nr:rRNA pseudouridine synthase [Holosporales bacterium]